MRCRYLSLVLLLAAPSILLAEPSPTAKPVVVVGIMDNRPYGWQEPDGRHDGAYVDMMRTLAHDFPEFEFKPKLVPYIRLTMGLQNSTIDLTIRNQNEELEECCIKYIAGVSAFVTASKKVVAHPEKNRIGVQIGQEAVFKRYAPSNSEPSPVGTYDQLWQMLQADRIEKILGVEATMRSALPKWDAIDPKRDLNFELVGRDLVFLYIRKDSAFAKVDSKAIQKSICATVKNDTGLVGGLIKYHPDYKETLGYKESIKELNTVCEL